MAQIPENSSGIELWLKLIRAEEVGPVTFGRLLKRFGSVDAALGASVSGLTKVEGIGFKTAERIAASRDKFDACAELELAAKLGVWLLHMEDPRYPAVLKQIYDPPPVLYVKGTLTREDTLGVAIVGCRRCSLYGQEQASRFAHLLAAAGFTIVSGMARGIDTAAHTGALAAQGRTIAVQGCGLVEHLSAGECQALRTHKCFRGLYFRASATGRAAGGELPAPQPDHRGPVPRDNCHRGGTSLGSPDHRQDRPGEQSRGHGRAGQDRFAPEPGTAQPHQAGRQADRIGRRHHGSPRLHWRATQGPHGTYDKAG